MENNESPEILDTVWIKDNKLNISCDVSSDILNDVASDDDNNIASDNINDIDNDDTNNNILNYIAELTTNTGSEIIDHIAMLALNKNENENMNESKNESESVNDNNVDIYKMLSVNLENHPEEIFSTTTIDGVCAKKYFKHYDLYNGIDKKLDKTILKLIKHTLGLRKMKKVKWNSIKSILKKNKKSSYLKDSYDYFKAVCL
jgi:hypothetical protein